MLRTRSGGGSRPARARPYTSALYLMHATGVDTSIAHQPPLLTVPRCRSILLPTGAPRRPAHWRGRRGFVEMPFHRALSLGLVVLSLLSACARVEPPIVPPTLGDTSQTPPPSQTPTPAQSPTSTPQAVCRDRAGRILTAEIPLPGDPRPLAYLVYLPPCYDPERETRYPTLYLMHGLVQSESEWVELGIAATADTLITQRSIPALVIVLPGERTGFDMLVALIDTLLPHVEQSMPTGGSPGAARHRRAVARWRLGIANRAAASRTIRSYRTAQPGCSQPGLVSPA